MPRPCRSLLVEAEVHQVVVLDNVRFCFQAQFAGAFGLRLATSLDEIVEADDLGADEPFLNVSMDHSGGFPRGNAVTNGPSAVFLASRRQEADVAALLESSHDQRVRSG